MTITPQDYGFTPPTPQPPLRPAEPVPQGESYARERYDIERREADRG